MAYQPVRPPHFIVRTLPQNLKNNSMEIITMESAAYKELLAKIDRIEHHIMNGKAESDNNGRNVWMSSREVMALLGISSRSLQRLREKGLIKHAMFGRACRYHISDVERFIKEGIVNAEADSLEEFKRNYLLKTGGKQ